MADPASPKRWRHCWSAHGMTGIAAFETEAEALTAMVRSLLTTGSLRSGMLPPLPGLAYEDRNGWLHWCEERTPLPAKPRRRATRANA